MKLSSKEFITILSPSKLNAVSFENTSLNNNEYFNNLLCQRNSRVRTSRI